MQRTPTTSFWRGRSVFVTGGAGLVGSWLIPALAARGARVLALAHCHAPRECVATIRGDVTDLQVIRRAIEQHAVDTVFHLAAQAIVGVAAQDPAATLDVNVRGAWTVLEAARATRACQVLIASSERVYGTAGAEDSPLRAQHPYETSKVCADLIANMYAVTYRLPVAIVRCGNVFGGGDRNVSRIIPAVILATLRNQPFLIRSDGQAVRNYLYVEDLVDAYLLLAETLASDPSLNGQAFNFALEQQFTVLEIADTVLRLMERPDLRPIVLGTSSDNSRQRRLNIEKAARVLGWRPRFGMEDGLRQSIRWYRDHSATLAGPHNAAAMS